MFTLEVVLGVRIHHSIIVFIEVRRVSLFFLLRVQQAILTIMCSKWLLGPLNCHSRANQTMIITVIVIRLLVPGVL